MIADAVARRGARAAGPSSRRARRAAGRPGGEELRAALRGDLHSHSDWSDGGSPIEEMAFTAMELGHDYLVLTDHSPRLTVANGLQRRAADPRSSTWSTPSTSTSATAFRLLKGIEVDILDDGSLDQTDEMLGPARRRASPACTPS